jgi:hypothetical protein
MAQFPVQTSFNGGELAPRLSGRIDLDKFKNGCRTLKNFIAHAHGPAYRRGGLRYVEPSKSHATRSRLMRFEFGVEQAYALEFGNLYIRFFANGSIIKSGGVPVEVVTPYTEAQLRSLRVTQSADVFYIFHKDHATRKLQRLLADGTSWQLTTIAFLPPPTYEPDMNIAGGTIVLAISAVTGQGVKVFASADVFYEADVGRGLKRAAGLASFTGYTSRKEMTADVLNDFAAALVDTTPVATLTTDAGADKKIINFSAAHGITAGQATAGIWLRLTTGPQVGEMKQVASVTDADTLILVAAWSVDQTAQNFSKHYAIAAAEWFLTGSPVSDCTPSAKAPINAIITLTLAANGWRTGASPNGDVGKYVRLFSGIVKITEVTSATVAKARILVSLIVNPIVAAAGGAWTCESEVWNAANGYPRAGCFFEQRFMVGGSILFPTTIWGSQSADYENFGLGPYDGDAVEYVLSANQVNDLRWMMPTKVLLLGTAGSEFRITGGADAPLTPSNVDAKNEDANGSADVSPVRIRNKIMFLQSAGRKILEIAYSFEPDSFLASDLAMLADHLTEGGIVEIAYQKEPESILWCVRADGVLLGVTYNPDQKIIAWHWHVTDGLVESICVIPDPVNLRDELWLMVARTIGGATKRYIERLDPDRPNADSFVLYQGVATATIPGLSHLEGKTVDILADGFVVKDKVVAAGQVILDHAVVEAVVGLNYESELIPNRPEFATGGVVSTGTTVGKKKQWVDVFVRLLETAGIEINGDELPFRTGAAPLGSPPVPFTGDRRVTNLGVEDDVDIVIKQKNPLPATVLLIGGTLDVGD